MQESKTEVVWTLKRRDGAYDTALEEITFCNQVLTVGKTRALLRLERTMNLLEGGKGEEGRVGGEGGDGTERGWGERGGEGTWGEREGGEVGEGRGGEGRGREGRGGEGRGGEGGEGGDDCYTYSNRYVQ